MKVLFISSVWPHRSQGQLGAEGVGKDVTMMIGNGYTKGHAEVALNILRESKEIRELFEKLYI